MCVCARAWEGGGGGLGGHLLRKYIIAHTEQESVPNYLLTFTVPKTRKEERAPR